MWMLLGLRHTEVSVSYGEREDLPHINDRTTMEYIAVVTVKGNTRQACEHTSTERFSPFSLVKSLNVGQIWS